MNAACEQCHVILENVGDIHVLFFRLGVLLAGQLTYILTARYLTTLVKTKVIHE